MTKEQEAAVRAALAGMDPLWVEEAIAQAREMSDDEDITVTVTTAIEVRVAAMAAHAKTLEQQNAVNERTQLARDAAYEIAMDDMNKLDDDPIVH